MKKEQLIHYNEALAEYLRRCHEDVCGVPWADTIYPIRLSIKKEHDLYYEDWETYHRKNLLANALRQQLMEQALWGNMDELPFDERKQADQKREESFRKLVVSEKGAGRTSLCRKIALAYVSDISSYKKEYHLTGKLTPVLLSGRCFDGREDSTDFADIAYQMFLCEVENISEEDFCAVMKEKARAGELIVLIDGMDEIAKGQSAFLSALSSFLDEYPKTRLIITMETPDFSDPENLNLIMRLEKEERTDILLVDPLSEEEICDFVRYWCRAVCPAKASGATLPAISVAVVMTGWASMTSAN